MSVGKNECLRCGARYDLDECDLCGERWRSPECCYWSRPPQGTTLGGTNCSDCGTPKVIKRRKRSGLGAREEGTR